MKSCLWSPIEAQSGAAANRKASVAALKHGGAVAFSRTGNLDTGEFGDAVILATYAR